LIKCDFIVNFFSNKQKLIHSFNDICKNKTTAKTAYQT